MVRAGVAAGGTTVISTFIGCPEAPRKLRVNEAFAARPPASASAAPVFRHGASVLKQTTTSPCALIAARPSADNGSAVKGRAAGK